MRFARISGGRAVALEAVPIQYGHSIVPAGGNIVKMLKGATRALQRMGEPTHSSRRSDRAWIAFQKIKSGKIVGEMRLAAIERDYAVEFASFRSQEAMLANHNAVDGGVK